MNYNEFLSRFCGCYPDSEGNHPCDNGAICDRCMTEEAIKTWEALKRKTEHKQLTSKNRR